MKKLIGLYSIFSILLLLSGCGSEVSPTKSTAINSEKKEEECDLDEGCDMKKVIGTANFPGELSGNYETVEKLANDSEIIVMGQVLTTNSSIKEEGIRVVTEYHLKITESFAGPHKKDDVIDLMSAGGSIRYIDFKRLNPEKESFENKLSGNEKMSGYVDYLLEGIPLIKENQQYLLFAKKEDIGDGKQIYKPLGLFQGQFSVTSSQISRYAPTKPDNIQTWEKADFINDLKKVLPN